MKTLPYPSGPYPVGSASCEIADSSRAVHLVSQDVGRRIFTKSWYPARASASDTCRRERLWEQIRSEPNVPGFAKLLLRPAMKVMTNSYEDAPYETAAGPPRILIYSHGLISFASENSMLMEHLASHGYVVIALQHVDQFAEFRALEKAQSEVEKSEVEKKEQAKLQRKIKASAVEGRAALWKEYFRIASNTNRIASARAVDIEYAIAKLETLLETIPGVGGISGARTVGTIGYSMGGAVATEFAKASNTGTGCVVNMDGGIYGTRPENPIDKAYLMLYSEENSGANDLSLAATPAVEITRRVIPGTKHLNLHDIAAIYPLLRWLGAIGSANPAAVCEERNRLVSAFLAGTDVLRKPSMSR
jgi:dienelactone hydrolase